ncbi:MAG TPA: hypothetical protein VKR23_14130 [Gaiellaceae bacterium]|nr:hypothetical protein [Gaiellaceae bacterium]
MSELLAERIEPDDALVHSILGTTDPHTIWQEVQTLCPEAVDCFAFQARVGALFGLTVRGGTRIALKVHRSRPSEHLAAIQEIQEHLWRYGYPTPRPLGVRGPATLEEWRDEGSARNAHEPEIRRELARQLVRLMQLTRTQPAAAGHLEPVVFDAPSGPEWIETVVEEARLRMDGGTGARVAARHDWTIGRFRFIAEKPVVVYGWDSLSFGPETYFVGEAAAQFTVTDQLPVEPWPTVDETFLFIADYERVRMSPFTREEGAAAAAAAAYTRARAARYVHALGGDVGALALPEYAAALLQ